MPCWSHVDSRICVSLAYNNYLPKPNRMCPLKVMIVHLKSSLFISLVIKLWFPLFLGI